MTEGNIHWIGGIHFATIKLDGIDVSCSRYYFMIGGGAMYEVERGSDEFENPIFENIYSEDDPENPLPEEEAKRIIALGSFEYEKSIWKTINPRLGINLYEVRRKVNDAPHRGLLCRLLRRLFDRKGEE